MQILLTGGSACGKSTYGERLAALHPGPRYYIATMRPFDEECLNKIARHRALRKDRGFVTVEKYTGIGEIWLPERGVALLECLCNLTANEMFGGAEERTEDAVLSGIRSLNAQCETLIVVTNDVSSDGGTYADSTGAYVKTLNRINRAVAAESDAVYELVCGIPVVWKGMLP